MNNDILGNFYRLTLPLFQPRTEALLRRTTPEELHRLTFRYIFTVDGMIEISHMIEDLVTAHRGIAQTHVSFQYFSRVAPQMDRYKKVAEASKGLWVYGAPDVTLPNLSNTTYVNTAGTPLENYWYVIAYGAGVSAALLAEEVTPPERLSNEPRMYEGFYTFEPETAYQTIALLHRLFPVQVSMPTAPEQLEA